MTAVPHQLAYDDLPAGSDVRREYDADGVVRVVVPAGEVPPPVRRVAAHAALVSGAAIATPVLLVSLGVFAYFVRANRVAGVPLVWAVAFFGIFCAAVAALVAWVRYRILVEAAQDARAQMTVLVASSYQLLVETTGPFGVASLEVPRGRIAALRCDRGRVTDAAGRERRVARLLVVVRGSRPIPLLPGRDVRELHWVARTLARVLGVPAPVG